MMLRLLGRRADRYSLAPMRIRTTPLLPSTPTRWFALVIVAALLVPALASAQRKKVVFGEDEEGSEIEGYVHKPEVGYIITRQEQEDLETLQLKESFVPKIVKSVEKRPF